jgi:1-piperideine-2-carboxylate/1-pyrroline-2-carboxylate reductase [NAD(P)H]
MLRLDAQATAAALPERELVDAMTAMFDRMARSEAHAPPRVHLNLPGGGVLLLMPAHDAHHTVLKTVTVHAGNAAPADPAAHQAGATPRRRLPVVQGEAVLMNTATGERLVQIEGATLTARRTAALSMAGLKRLGRDHATRMLIIGAGVQAAMHARFFLKLWPLAQLQISSRDRSKAHALAQALQKEHLRSAVRIEAIDAALDLPTATQRADLIVTATNSATPVLHAALRPSATIVAVGAYRASMAELAPELVQSCRTIVVDAMANASHEAGDLLQAGVDWSTVTELSQWPRPAEPAGPVLLKTVGHALWDLAAAELAWQHVKPR